jgi:hypothetical protein
LTVYLKKTNFKSFFKRVGYLLDLALAEENSLAPLAILEKSAFYQLKKIDK